MIPSDSKHQHGSLLEDPLDWTIQFSREGSVTSRVQVWYSSKMEVSNQDQKKRLAEDEEDPEWVVEEGDAK